MDHKRNGNPGPGPIPNRWLNCPRKASNLLTNKFLAFKTPLDAKFDDQVPLQCRFTPSMLLQSLKSHSLKLCLWIDLTKTSRYYDREQIEAAGCSYVKIQCQGHEGTPTVEQTNTFITLCNRFIQYHPLDMIGVHCTHGFNRTGFLLVAYLVEKMDCSVEAALQEFAKIRPPGIYKEDYIKELYRRYDDENDALPAPALPNWCSEENESSGSGGNFNNNNNNGCESEQKSNNNSNNNNNNNRSLKSRKPKYKENALFMAGVPGVETITDKSVINSVHQKVNELCSINYSSFCGSQPVSMDKSNIHLLSTKGYKVSWKADGTRYMMLIVGREQVYFLDRDNSVFKTSKIQFFNRKTGHHLVNTLVDGEMVIDKVGNTNIPRYLIYDIVIFEGNKTGDQPFPIRLRVIEVDIITPRIDAMKEGRINKQHEPFSVRAKQFYDTTMSEYLLSEKFGRKLTHDPDGLVFQPCDDPYTFGATPHVLKWKPLSMNSVDFLLQVERETRTGYANQFVGNLITYDKGVPIRFGEIKCTKTVRALNGRIIECKFEDNQWVLMRERTDKSFPNSFDTARAVCGSIRDPVSKQILLQYIANHAWKDPMPPPLSRPPTKRFHNQ